MSIPLISTRNYHIKWSIRNCQLKKTGSLTPKCWTPKALHFWDPEQWKVKVECHWLHRFVHQGLFPAGWKPSESWPLVWLFAPRAPGAWKRSMALEAGQFRNSCQVAASFREAQKVPTKQETFPRIPGLRPNKPGQLLVKVMFFSATQLK